MIEIIEYKPEHMAKVKIAKDDRDILLFLDDLDQRAAIYAKAGEAVTMIDGDEVLAVGGIVRFWKGVGEAWMMVSEKGRLQKVALYRAMQEFFDRCFAEYGYHRIQVSVVESHHQSHKCMMRLGFIPEGMQVHFGPDRENFVRYVKLGAGE